MPLAKFFDAVLAGPRCSDKSSLFNPWVDFDADNDLSSSSPAHRFEHLQAYMRERESSARFLLIAEAPGYCGCKFSGLAMTSERALLASDQDLLDSHYFLGPKHRTSKFSPALKNNDGMLERTATIVWGKMMSAGLQSHEFVLWNSFAWHPHLPGNRLTNRAPTKEEKAGGKEALRAFLDAFRGRTVLAIGDHSQGLLSELGVEVHKLRHPSYGGATIFREGVEALLRSQV